MSNPAADRAQLRIRVASPCPMRWEALTPVSGGRHCAACQKVVVDVERLTSAQLDALVESGERACVRITTLSDGSVLTRDHPRASRRAAAWAGAALAASTFACSDGTAQEEQAVCTEAIEHDTPAPSAAAAASADTRSHRERSIAGRRFEARPIPTQIDPETATVEVGGLDPMLHGGIEPPPEMPALDLLLPLSGLGGTTGEGTVVLGSIGETLPIFEEDFLEPVHWEID